MTPTDFMVELERRLVAVEAAVHQPIDFTPFVVERAETVARLFEADPHQFSTRPCSTCRAVSSLLGRSFGCDAKAKR